MDKRLLVGGALLATTIMGAAGGSTLNALQAFAQESPTVTTAQNNPQPSNQPQDQQKDPSVGGHVGANGKKEELLTGDTAEKTKAAALAAVPGGTIQRVETDAEGAAYEAHMTKSDGSRVTVKFDSNFKVTSTDAGMR